MWIFRVGEKLAIFLVKLLPRRFALRIQENSSDYNVYVLSSKKIKMKPRMTFIEAVFATILFDLALFGTSNSFIGFIIRFFTKLQNSWNSPFASKEDAKSQIKEFCLRLDIQQEPWIWEKGIEEYNSLNDFFSRTYHKKYFPQIGSSDIVSPASCTIMRFSNDSTLEDLLIKGCNYKIEDIGLSDAKGYKNHDVFIGYLSPTDYHRVHAPISGTITHLCYKGLDKHSASVKFFSGKFNILNENKRLLIEIAPGNLKEKKVALVVIGGIGVDSINLMGDLKVGQKIMKGGLISAFRAGGSAIAMFSSSPLKLTEEFIEGERVCQHIEVQVGESIADYESTENNRD